MARQLTTGESGSAAAANTAPWQYTQITQTNSSGLHTEHGIQYMYAIIYPNTNQKPTVAQPIRIYS